MRLDVTVLQRCGSTRVLRAGWLAVLGDGHAAWLAQVDGRRVIRLRDLERGTTRTFGLRRPEGAGGRLALAFSADRFVVSEMVGGVFGDGLWAVSLIPLQTAGRRRASSRNGSGGRRMRAAQ